MEKNEAIAWLSGKADAVNFVPKDPIETWEVRIAQANAAKIQAAYYVAKAHKESEERIGMVKSNPNGVYGSTTSSHVGFVSVHGEQHCYPRRSTSVFQEGQRFFVRANERKLAVGVCEQVFDGLFQLLAADQESTEVPDAL